MLDARGLTKRYDDHVALHPLTLSVPRGEVFCLLGANGAGKTTTINLFLGFTPPSGGVAEVAGVDVQRAPLSARQHLAYIPETVMLYRTLSGMENLRYFTDLAGRPDVTDARLREILLDVGLPGEAADRRVGTYSKGMRQKVGIAIAVAKDAEALLLDEPTSGLDPQAANEFSRLIERLAGRGVAVLMATHDLFRAKESGTRVGIMKHGHLVQTLATADIGHADLERVYLDHMRD
ncbi:MAG: ABC transporter ATP-binding protein [Gemmatimonadaceae bacterium]|jgi:ABC-2 type transport system ATP-binding protein|nr:ABC transporter ATP-binding protein [Gemmatimonadaceae bacterium]